MASALTTPAQAHLNVQQFIFAEPVSYLCTCGHTQAAQRGDLRHAPHVTHLNAQTARAQHDRKTVCDITVVDCLSD
jgi:hypothetical protein